MRTASILREVGETFKQAQKLYWHKRPRELVCCYQETQSLDDRSIFTAMKWNSNNVSVWKHRKIRKQTTYLEVTSKYPPPPKAIIAQTAEFSMTYNGTLIEQSNRVDSVPFQAPVAVVGTSMMSGDSDKT